MEFPAISFEEMATIQVSLPATIFYRMNFQPSGGSDNLRNIHICMQAYQQNMQYTINSCDIHFQIHSGSNSILKKRLNNEFVDIAMLASLKLYLLAKASMKICIWNPNSCSRIYIFAFNSAGRLFVALRIHLSLNETYKIHSNFICYCFLVMLMTMI